ncbi:SDR family NAD(P)-dependent oxidoreductase [Pseudogulbenkiania ferrooxidans]|uniref:Short-chain dehydrogenase/reductase SDR n=1 Tax=Pseudogulbenkiania ferrooxidans 2002 TaxID=279714 RepID=B9Z2P8_9NEIS|nr:SDR family NAD(P)-dependent oxidoreductase [Pseudogulbenkiania ferrooxidans]EEG08851.1 short-chain dehydrogenase/reductase SDR [Pseudogulbenkiania ferrooxidans 2002]
MSSAAIVTGASRGLGLALCSNLLARGFCVAALARSQGEGLARLAEAHPGQLHWLSTDLSDPAQQDSAIARALATLPRDGQILLINNAGVVWPIAVAGHYDDHALRHALSLNLAAPMVLSNRFLADTAAWSDRRILNVSSGAAVKAYPGWGVYGSGKAGLDHFSRHLAVEQAASANPVRVAAVYPGVIDTDMQAEIRHAAPESFPNLPRFLALKQEGALDSPEAAAGKLLDYLLGPRFGEEPVADIRALP